MKNVKYNEFNIIKKQICQELNYLKYDFSLIGTTQLFYCILLCLKHPCYIRNLNKYCYSILSKKFFIEPNTVKSNIFKAIENSYYECDEKILNEYFNVKFVSKPKTKEVVVSICQHILMK